MQQTKRNLLRCKYIQRKIEKKNYASIVQTLIGPIGTTKRVYVVIWVKEKKKKETNNLVAYMTSEFSQKK